MNRLLPPTTPRAVVETCLILGFLFAGSRIGTVAGWPWLWYDTTARWGAYWGTSVRRATIMVEYFIDRRRSVLSRTMTI